MATNRSPADDDGRQEPAIADKSTPVALVLALVLSPVAYYYVGRTKLAVINLLTLNYLLLGIVIVPVHVYTIINDARTERGSQTEDW
ncbi:TM2 domain-containing protein [Natrinema caseinilyticum]|uniref:TM2 domain-containing protein n=1 Tax=Natrinema caseinilyticum TaxID=2961570 RepID=UPI0020C1EC22|nr:TM2 domain-containing protein [Natrinema caseinilyticum]